MNCTVRQVTASDIPRLAELWYDRACLSAAHGLPKSRMTERQRHLLAALDQQAVCLRACTSEQGVIEGYIGATIAADVVTIDDLTLDLHQYHAGVGRRLVTAVVDWARECGATRLRAVVSRHSMVEQAFWLSMQGERRSRSPRTDEFWLTLPTIT